MILVVGSRNSSNSNRLREIGEELGKPSYLIDDADALQPEWFVGVRVGRRHRRRIGAGDAGAGRAGRAAPVRRDRHLHPGRRGGGRALPLPARNWPTHKGSDANGRAVEPGAAGRRLCREAAPAGAEALPAGADAGAAVPLQPGLRRLRQDRLSGRDPEPAPVGRRVHGGDRRVRRAGGGDRRRRAAAASRDRADRRRAPSRARSSSSSAPTRCCWKRRCICSSRASGSPGRCIWTARARSTTSRSARTASTTARWRRSPRPSAPASAPSSTATLFDNAKPERVAAFFDDVMAMGVDGISRLARLRV